MRAFWAIVKNAFHSSGSGGAKASINAGIAMALSGAVLFSLIAGAWMYIFMNWLARFNTHLDTVIVVNAPEEFKECTAEADLTDFRIVYKEHPYIFDVSTFSSMMKEEDSKLTVVFDENGDVLTFYPTDSLDNYEIRDHFKDTALAAYANHIKAEAGIPTMEFPAVYEYVEGLDAPPSETHFDPFERSLAYMLVPLLYFIAVLYSSMTKGTNVIAGAKEQNAFAAILMTPTPRIVIVLGNIVGVWLSSMIPAAVITLLCVFSSFNKLGVLTAILLMAVLSFFIASLVILISVMSNNIITAQTAFLPVFFVFVTVCITCMQNPEEYYGIYEYIPLYGQYLGIAEGLTTGISAPPLIGSTFTTLLLSAVCIVVSVKLLGSERFTVSVMSASDKEVLRAKKEAARAATRKSHLTARCSVFGYNPTSSMNDLSFSLSQIFRPLILLSVFQLIALIPPLLMTNGEYLTSVMYSLKSVENVSDVLTSGSSIIGVLMSTPAFLLSMGLGYILINTYYCLRVRLLERTPLSSGLGLPLKPASSVIKRYLIGLAVGLGTIAAVFGILVISGQINVTGFGISVSSLPLFFAYIFMWFFQGACEEIMFRGYMMPRIAARFGLVPAIAVSSLLFCLFHGLNPGFSVIAFINLILISVLYGLIAYYTGNIWIVCAAHTMWNFTQGNIFGLEVSGNMGNVSLIHTSLSDKANALITGGTFGPEGGLAVTGVIVIALVVVLLLSKRSKINKG